MKSPPLVSFPREAGIQPAYAGMTVERREGKFKK